MQQENRIFAAFDLLHGRGLYIIQNQGIRGFLQRQRDGFPLPAFQYGSSLLNQLAGLVGIDFAQFGIAQGLMIPDIQIRFQLFRGQRHFRFTDPDPVLFHRAFPAGLRLHFPRQHRLETGNPR